MSESGSATPGKQRNTRQSQTYLSQLLAAQGLRAKRQLGQNFLIDLNLLDLLVRSATIGPRDVILEVGAGTGGLTTRLVERAGHVVSVEIDPGFYRLVRAELEGADNVTLLHADVLAGKNKIEPAVIEALREAMARVETDHYAVVANLPYDVASSLIANLILHELDVRSLTFTVQYEVGQRILAHPGSSHYGPLAVLVSTVGRSELIRTLPPTAFWPRPKVTSAFVRIDIDHERRRGIADLFEYHQFIRQLFIHRRKNLPGGIQAIPVYKPMKKSLPAILESAGLERSVRAEQLDPSKLYELFHRLEAARSVEEGTQGG